MRKAKVDDNQQEIVEALRKAGCSVAITSSAHDGFPDIVVGRANENYMIEIKDGNKPPSRRKLTSKQVKFHSEWLGQIDVAKDVEEAFKIVGLISES